MKNSKKKKAAKKAAKKKPGLLAGAGKSLKKLGKGNLGTTSAVLIGATLAGLGARYLSKRRAQQKAAVPAEPRNDDAALAEFNLTTLEEEATA